jgi:hypothetical protein
VRSRGRLLTRDRLEVVLVLVMLHPKAHQLMAVLDVGVLGPTAHPGLPLKVF